MIRASTPTLLSAELNKDPINYLIKFKSFRLAQILYILWQCSVKRNNFFSHILVQL